MNNCLAVLGLSGGELIIIAIALLVTLAIVGGVVALVVCAATRSGKCGCNCGCSKETKPAADAPAH